MFVPRVFRPETYDVRAILRQYPFVLLQDLLQLPVVARVSLLDQTLKGHDLFIAVAEAEDESFQALGRCLLVARAETGEEEVLVA